MEQPIRLDAILAKIESVYGTDSIPVVADDAVRVSERVWSSLKVEHVFPNSRDDAASGSLIGVAPAKPKGRIVTLDVAWEARGSGTAGDVPEASPLFRACGMAETVNVAVDVRYAPADTSLGSASIHAYAGGKLYKIVGGRGTWTWELTAGTLGLLRFQMQGILTADPTEVSLPAVTYHAQIPEAAVGATLAVGGWTPDVLTSEMALGAEVQRLDDANAVDGVGLFAISKMNPTYKLNARVDPLATYDPYTIKKDATGGNVDQTLGATAGNILSLDINSVAFLMDIGHAEDNEFAAYELEYAVRGSFELIWT